MFWQGDFGCAVGNGEGGGLSFCARPPIGNLANVPGSFDGYLESKAFGTLKTCTRRKHANVIVIVASFEDIAINTLGQFERVGL